MRRFLIFPLILWSLVAWISAASAEPPRVAADIAPVHSLVAQVMQGVGTPDLIIPAGGSPHHHALRPSEAAALSGADLVIWMGPALTPWLDSAIAKLAADSRQVVLLDAEASHLLPLREGIAFDDEDHENHEAHGEAEAHHHAGGIDPHAWLAPGNARIWLALIAGELAALDPENADLYRANAQVAAQEIDAMSQQISDRLRPDEIAPFIVFHDAYQYFEQAFDLRAAAAVSLGDAARPGPARLAALRDMIVQEGIACVLTEPQTDPGLARAILPVGHRVGVLDPLGAQIPPGPAHYTLMMMALAEGFAVCAP